MSQLVGANALRGNKPQFGLRSELGFVAFVAVMLALLRLDGGFVLVLPVVTITASLSGVALGKNPWRHLFWAWAAVLAICSLIAIELASGYSATIPLVGVVPGPPSIGMMRCFQFAVWAAAIFGLFECFQCLRRVPGVWQKALCLVPGLLLLCVVAVLLMRLAGV